MNMPRMLILAVAAIAAGAAALRPRRPRLERRRPCRLVARLPHEPGTRRCSGRQPEPRQHTPRE